MYITEIVKLAESIPSITSPLERACLAELAQEVPQTGGLIVEVGSLYGGTTAVLALAAPGADIFTIDDFAWYPQDWEYGPTSVELLYENMKKLGVITNVRVHKGDSLALGKSWNTPINLLWIDGGHSYEIVRADLENFGPHADVIALHDWDNPIWATIRQAVEDFVSKHTEWKIERNVEMVVVLRKK
jgi:MMP 1-O-methyltransferase